MIGREGSPRLHHSDQEMGDPSVLERSLRRQLRHPSCSDAPPACHDLSRDSPTVRSARSDQYFWHSVFVRALKKDGATARVSWRTYVHIGAESRSRRSPCRLGFSSPPTPNVGLCLESMRPDASMVGGPLRPIIDGRLRTCMHACPPMSTRRSNHAHFNTGFWYGTTLPRTTDLLFKTCPFWAIWDWLVDVCEIFRKISRTNTTITAAFPSRIPMSGRHSTWDGSAENLGLKRKQWCTVKHGWQRLNWYILSNEIICD